MKKSDFLAPSDVMEHHGAAVATAVAIAPTLLLGTWNNCDHGTRGLLRVVIAAAGAGITVQAFGSCTPTPCDWGKVAGLAYAENVTAPNGIAFTAVYKLGFKETILVGHLDAGMLMVETFDNFIDGSGRSDYYSRYYMYK